MRSCSFDIREQTDDSNTDASRRHTGENGNVVDNNTVDQRTSWHLSRHLQTPPTNTTITMLWIIMEICCGFFCIGSLSTTLSCNEIWRKVLFATEHDLELDEAGNDRKYNQPFSLEESPPENT